MDINYNMGLIDDPNLKYLWLPNRDRSLGKATKQVHLIDVESFGYHLSELIHTSHETT
ncbi:hypothetical protein [Acinetobacter sp.]|uniref:hypothetical protein n=1 Tax=Acinetobacter sp. TaxID=472 RepID=UPI00388EA0C0